VKLSIPAFAMDPRDTRVIFAASASGGAWKTENAGTTWRPVFENEGSVSLGAIALAPSNPDIVWVGTGEQNSVRSSSYGDGVYRSDDGGTTWRNMGLEGSQWSMVGGGPEGGLFRSEDGGESSLCTLYLSAFNLGAFLFQFINTAFPDPLWTQPRLDRIPDVISQSIAALVIASPIFLYTARKNARAISQSPIKRTSPVPR
jgi:hypothetical protein